MPITKTVTLYTYDELSPAAQAKARDWYREGQDHDLDNVTECTVVPALEKLGVRLSDHVVPLHGGSARRVPDVWYSVGYTQNDGVAFEGRYEYVKGASAAVRDEFPQDAQLHNIARDLQAIQRRYGYKLTVDVSTHHRDCTPIDEYVTDTITSNEYTFTESGDREE